MYLSRDAFDIYITKLLLYRKQATVLFISFYSTCSLFQRLQACQLSVSFCLMAESQWMDNLWA